MARFLRYFQCGDTKYERHDGKDKDTYTDRGRTYRFEEGIPL